MRSPLRIGLFRVWPTVLANDQTYINFSIIKNGQYNLVL